jgi:hypothetical protein
MATTAEGRTPVHLWIVGILSLLWSCFGAYDYWMSHARDTAYIGNMMPGVDPNAALAWMDAMPMYAKAGWGIGVWLGLLGSILLLLRSRYAVWSFGISFIGAVLSLGWQIALAPPLAGATGALNTAMPYIIIALAAFLFWYAWSMEKKGVLR